MRLIFLMLLILSFPVLAHQNSITSSQNEIKWNYLNIPLRIDNLSSIQNSATIVDEAIQEWNNSSKLKIFKSGSGNNRLKLLNDFSIYGSAVIGVTEVNYSNSGEINTASILLNDQNYNFVDTPGMISNNNVYLKDVLTHELGHFVGLSHSEVLDSTMFYSNFPGQSELAADDKAGIRSKYETSYGKIFGHVRGGSHIGVLGVHVQAISRSTGETIGSISDQNGYFEISGLDLNDTYYLYTSPLKNLDALPDYFSNVQSEFCPSSYVGSFFTACGRENDGIPQGINLSPEQSVVNVGEVTINCSLKTQENYNYQKIGDNFSSVEVFTQEDNSKTEKAYVGFFRTTALSKTSFSSADKFLLDMRGVASPSDKKLKIKLISRPFGNPVEYSMTVKQNDVEIDGSPFTKTEKIPEYTLSLDLKAERLLSTIGAENIFEIEIKAKKLSTDDAIYSIPDVVNFASNKVMPYLMIFSLEDGNGVLLDSGSDLSDNYSCLDAPFTYAVEKSTFSSRNTTTESQLPEANTAAACATITDGSGSGPGSGPGQFLVTLTIGFILSLLLSKFGKRSKNFLS